MERKLVLAAIRVGDVCICACQRVGLVLEINRTVVVCLPTYISMHRTRVEFLVP